MKKEWLGNLAILVLSLVCAGIIVEAFVRVVVDDGMQFDLEMWKYARLVKTPSPDPEIGHSHAPGRRARLMGVDVATNAAGLRDDRDYAHERTPGTLRILMIGDSLTEGWGVPLESTFTKRIERKYRERGINAEVLNAGVGNYNTLQQVAAFFAEHHKYKPDIVVLNYFVNDAEPTPRAVVPSFIASTCYSCVYLTGRVDTLLRMTFSGRKDWFSYYLDLYAGGSGKGWLDAKHAITRLADYCKKNGITLLIASLPELHDVQNYRLQIVTDLVRDTARESSVAFVDILPYLKDQPSSKLWVTPPDPHPNAHANQFIAEGLFAALSEVEPAWVKATSQ